MNQNQTGTGPYSKSLMRALGTVSCVLSIGIVVWGAFLAADGDASGTRMMVIGGLVLAVMALAIPLAIRRGRM